MQINLTLGINCSTPSGCVANLRPNNIGTLIPTDKYLLLSGSAYLSYNGAYETITSPYTGKEGWQDYVDVWAYNAPTIIKTDRTTEFMQINGDDCTVKTIILTSGNSISFSANASSYVAVIGNTESYLVNGSPGRSIEGKVRYFDTYGINETSQFEIQSLTDTCKVVYIEKV